MKKFVFAVCMLICYSAYALTTAQRDNWAIFTLSTLAIVDQSGPLTSESFPTGPYDSYSIQCAWSSLSGPDTVYVIETTNDNSNWDIVSGSSVTASTTNGSFTTILNPFPVRFARIRITNSSTSGNLDCVAIGQGRT